jgi:hypothetical protein
LYIQVIESPLIKYKKIEIMKYLITGVAGHTPKPIVLSLLQAGLPQEIAKNFAEMGSAIRTGKLLEEYWKPHPDSSGKTKLEDFAKSFASAYNAN